MVKEQVGSVLPEEICEFPKKVELQIGRASTKRVKEIGDGCCTLPSVPLRPGDWRNLNNLRLEVFATCHKTQTLDCSFEEKDICHPHPLRVSQIWQEDNITHIGQAKITVGRVQPNGRARLVVALPPDYTFRGESKVVILRN